MTIFDWHQKHNPKPKVVSFSCYLVWWFERYLPPCRCASLVSSSSVSGAGVFRRVIRSGSLVFCRSFRLCRAAMVLSCLCSFAFCLAACIFFLWLFCRIVLPCDCPVFRLILAFISVWSCVVLWLSSDRPVFLSYLADCFLSCGCPVFCIVTLSFIIRTLTPTPTPTLTLTLTPTLTPTLSLTIVLLSSGWGVAPPNRRMPISILWVWP